MFRSVGPRSCLISLAWLASSSAGADPLFTGLGDLPGGSFFSTAQDVSADGLVVVGFSSSDFSAATAAQAEAFRWTADEGMVGLGDLPGGGNGSEAADVSADGSVIGPDPFPWTV